jgi:hypothetical protein
MTICNRVGYHSCALNMEDVISSNFFFLIQQVVKIFTTHFSVYFTNRLTHFCTTLYCVFIFLITDSVHFSALISTNSDEIFHKVSQALRIYSVLRIVNKIVKHKIVNIS